MRLISTLLGALAKGWIAFFWTLSMALSFAPATSAEVALFGADATRQQLVERRLALGVLRLDTIGMFSTVADIANVPEPVLRTALTDIAHHTRITNVAQTSAPEPPQPNSRSDTGARFVQVD